MLLATVAALFIYHRSLRGMRKRVLEVREGLLLPVDIVSWSPPFLRRLLQDYNQSIAALSSIFKTVEECQGRVLNERNRIDIILQSLSAALLTVSNDLNINLSNRLAEKTFKKSADELYGMSLFDLIQFRPDDRDLIRDSFLYKKPIRNQEIYLEIESEPKWFSLSINFFSEVEEEMEAVLILLDVSEHRQMQDTLNHSERLIAMGQLAAGVAHELNTPLGNVLGYVQLIKSDLDKDSSAYDYANTVETETRRCSNIITNLLNFAKQDSCSGDTCQVNQVLDNVTQAFLKCRTQRYGIDVRLNLQPDMPSIEGECGQLEIVFTNLITNAIQALHQTDSPYIAINSWVENGDFVYVSVEDNGTGIPASVRPHIFDPFFTTKEVGSGTGLGLSISQALLNKRGAFIRYDNHYTKGARFIIGLPFVDEKRNVA